MALCRFLLGDHLIFIGYASDFMAILFAHDRSLILVLSGAVHFVKRDESLTPKTQTFLQHPGLDHSSSNLVRIGFLA